MSCPRSFTVLLMLCLLAFTSVQAAPTKAPAASTEQAPASPTWPQVLTSGDTKLTIYQPQLDSWDGYILQARAAVEATGGDGKSTYGIVQFSAHTLVDKATRWVASIITSDVPALLVYIDGEPAYRPVDGTALQRVINTRPLFRRRLAINGRRCKPGQILRTPLKCKTSTANQRRALWVTSA